MSPEFTTPAQTFLERLQSIDVRYLDYTHDTPAHQMFSQFSTPTRTVPSVNKVSRIPPLRCHVVHLTVDSRRLYNGSTVFQLYRRSRRYQTSRTTIWQICWEDWSCRIVSRGLLLYSNGESADFDIR